MKFHLIAALLITVIMNIYDSIGLIIWHGAQARGNDFNWVVKIIAAIENSTRGSHCTGSVISELHILTAAHCFETAGTNITVIAGTICLHGTCRSEHRVKEVHIHPSYGINDVNIPRPNYTPMKIKIDDVAVLTLETPLSFGEKIAAIPLPTEALDLSQNLEICRMAGWGKDFSGELPLHLLWTTMKIESSAGHNALQRLHKLILAKNPDVDTHTTGGDSGAGLICEGVVAGVLIGSISQADRPTIFESVYHYLDFINETQEKDAALLTAIRNAPKRKKRRPCICL